MKESELKTVLNVVKISDLNITKYQWDRLKEKILILSEPFFENEVI